MDGEGPSLPMLPRARIVRFFLPDRRFAGKSRRVMQFSGGKSPSSYDRYIQTDWQYVQCRSVSHQGGYPYRIRFQSPGRFKKGAQGLMQLMPGTAEDLQVDNPFNPGRILMAGCAISEACLTPSITIWYFHSLLIMPDRASSNAPAVSPRYLRRWIMCVRC